MAPWRYSNTHEIQGHRACQNKKLFPWIIPKIILCWSVPNVSDFFPPRKCTDSLCFFQVWTWATFPMFSSSQVTQAFFFFYSSSSFFFWCFAFAHFFSCSVQTTCLLLASFLTLKHHWSLCWRMGHFLFPRFLTIFWADPSSIDGGRYCYYYSTSEKYHGHLWNHGLNLSALTIALGNIYPGLQLHMCLVSFATTCSSLKGLSVLTSTTHILKLERYREN